MKSTRSNSPALLKMNNELIDDYQKQSNNDVHNNMILPTYDKESTIMTSSIASVFDDSTPSDSGVQMMDSISSGGLNESLITNSEFDFETTSIAASHQTIVDDCSIILKRNQSDLPDLVLPLNDLNNKQMPIAGNNVKLNENNDNNNVMENAMDKVGTPDEMKTSTCSTFDTENIVYRRKTKKTRHNSTTGPPKKRVSFHEDILKNTKIDNIHIEHGFITYKGYTKKPAQIVRYSWCSEGENPDHNNDDDGQRQYYFRNACSDVLDYGKVDLYEKENNYFKYDNSGVFEYGPHVISVKNNRIENTSKQFYNCNCSSSNSSLDSREDGNANIKQNYGQAKSSSCDCIGSNHNATNVPIISDNCYFSEPNIESIDDDYDDDDDDDDEHTNIKPKSVWSKEKKPKSSCLKKNNNNYYKSDVIFEQNLSKKLKTFNVHHLTDMNNLIDNSKNILGSIKNIFTIPLPERGVPEGCEDLQSVYECLPDNDNNFSPISPINSDCCNHSNSNNTNNTTINNKPRTFLSKSFDGGLYKDKGKPKKYIHNVDEQLRKKHDKQIYSGSGNTDIKKNTPNISSTINTEATTTITTTTTTTATQSPNIYRNKYIINCESIVFEHTGVSYENGNCLPSPITNVENVLPMVISSTVSTPFQPIKNKLTNIIKSLRDPAQINNTIQHTQFDQNNTEIKQKIGNNTVEYTNKITSDINLPTQSTKSLPNKNDSDTKINSDYSPTKTRHLSSPLRKKSIQTTRLENSSHLSPDKFGGKSLGTITTTTAFDEFDDILTITTSGDSDIAIVDYPEQIDFSNNFLKPPPPPPPTSASSSSSSSTTKSSLINRFLRNVTQKKIQEVTIRKNTMLIKKSMKQDRKLFGNLYVKGAHLRPDRQLIEDLNAEIALEIEQLGNVGNTNRRILHGDPENGDRFCEFGLGVGEIPIDIFPTNNLSFITATSEILIKVFKLFTGYSLEGYMTPVLVFLSNQTLYVTELIKNRLFNKFVLPYAELDVILIGPHGNTVLLSNGARDMQQVLLAGGPYPADGLVSSLEMCARRGGFVLPSIGQLTLDHLAPLQNFVRANSTISMNDPWIYYAVVSVPTTIFNQDDEPLGPNIKGPLMYRKLFNNNINNQPQWAAGYFLLKAGVLYMFNDTQQKLPNIAIALYECKGVRRALKSNRPHCFELLLKSSTMQLAAPDEYVASEWLQALVQSASGLFEIQDKHKTLGCTLVITSSHIVTLREDFSAPLRRVNGRNMNSSTMAVRKNCITELSRKLSLSTLNDAQNDSISNISCSTKISDGIIGSNKSSPARSISSTITTTTAAITLNDDEKSFSSMSSIYGKNSGVEIKSCAALKDMASVRIPAQNYNWWCILEFSCQEVKECSDDMVIFFATNSDMRRFLTLLETLWQSKHDIPFPIDILRDDNSVSKHCSDLFIDLNKSWDPLIAAALGYPQ